MSSKRFRGKPCAYCIVNPATTGDHIIAREFFLPTARADLPQVPACEACNNHKSQLEHYLTALLPFGGRHADARDNLANQVARRLRRNQKLARELDIGRGRIWTFELDELQQTMTLPIDGDRLAELFAMVGRGLALHHFGVSLQEGQISGTIFPSAEGAVFYDWVFQLSADNRITKSLGNGTVSYTGLIANLPLEVTMWRLHFYGGILLSEASGPETAISSEIVVVTGPQDFVNKLREM
ncbi:MAG: HNH endonuclease [Methylotenera sp.]|uniref:HNH endonuclease n=1 Tax=Methylotenera sp. TaxID=2051956 RepID=UPI000D40536C|nr:hypothetical protein [Methylotenera sp.]PPC83167.1 MAG: HNH endonuclease [Methylotenera sp.]